MANPRARYLYRAPKYKKDAPEMAPSPARSLLTGQVFDPVTRRPLSPALEDPRKVRKKGREGDRERAALKAAKAAQFMTELARARSKAIDPMTGAPLPFANVGKLYSEAGVKHAEAGRAYIDARNPRVAVHHMNRASRLMTIAEGYFKRSKLPRHAKTR